MLQFVIPMLYVYTPNFFIIYCLSAWCMGAIMWLSGRRLLSKAYLPVPSTLEAWHIRSQPHPINRERDRLQGTYDILLPRHH